MEGESSSGSKIETKVPIISNEYSLNILKGEANDHFFEGESPFKKARRFEQEVNFKILQNEELLQTMLYSCSHRVIISQGLCWLMFAEHACLNGPRV